MSRPLRIEFPDGWYHVMNRGLRRHATFIDDQDHKLFLDTVGQACNLFGVNIAAYCLMPNHYHLLVQTPNSNLSRFMRHVNGVYTQRFNRKNGKDGPLFRGRYRAIVVDVDSYLLQVVRYIHLNPVKGGLTDRPDKFRWSSHRYYLKPREHPDWLDSWGILSFFHSQSGKALERYKSFMKKPQEPELEIFYGAKKQSWVLGAEGFVKKMKKKVEKRKDFLTEGSEVRQVKGEVRLSKLALEVSRLYKITKKTLLSSRRGMPNLPRKIAIYLAWEMSGLPQREIAEYFGVGSPRTVSVHHYNIKQQIQKDRQLREAINKLKNKISQ